MRLNWVKITMIMITINLMVMLSVNLYTNSLTPKDIIGYYEENKQYEFNSDKNMGIMPSVLLFSKSMGTNVNNLKGDDPNIYYKTNNTFWNVVDGIVNVALFIGMFFEITINALFNGIELGYANNTTELFILSFIVLIINIGNLLLIVKGYQLWANKDTS